MTNKPPLMELRLSPDALAGRPGLLAAWPDWPLDESECPRPVIAVRTDHPVREYTSDNGEVLLSVAPHERGLPILGDLRSVDILGLAVEALELHRQRFPNAADETRSEAWKAECTERALLDEEEHGP